MKGPFHMLHFEVIEVLLQKKKSKVDSCVLDHSQAIQ